MGRFGQIVVAIINPVDEFHETGGLCCPYNPGIAETLDVRDEGGTAGILPKENTFHPGCAYSRQSICLVSETN